MKRRLIGTLLSLSILLSACGAQPGAVTTTMAVTEATTIAATEATSAPATTATTAEPTTTAATTTRAMTAATIAPATSAAKSAGPDFVTVESNATSVRLTIPKSALDFLQIDASDLMWQAYGEGISTIKANPDGSLTYTLTKAEYQELLAVFKSMVDEGIRQIVAESSPVIRSIKYNTRMTEFQVRVDRKKFTAAHADAVTGLQMPALVYQLYLGVKVIDMGVVFKFIDNSTGKVIQTIRPTDSGL